MIFYLIIIYLFIQVSFSLNVNKCTNTSYKIVGKIYFIWKIFAVIDTTFAVAKRKPENI